MPKRSVDGGSGTLTAAPVAGTATAGNTLFLGRNSKKLDNLSCKCVLLAETNTITLEAQWQVSHDGTTWFTIKSQNNASAVVFGTGTAGADSSVTAVIDAPQGLYGWEFCRMVVINRVATGAVGDTYAFTYQFRMLSPGDS